MGWQWGLFPFSGALCRVHARLWPLGGWNAGQLELFSGEGCPHGGLARLVVMRVWGEGVPLGVTQAAQCSGRAQRPASKHDTRTVCVVAVGLINLSACSWDPNQRACVVFAFVRVRVPISGSVLGIEGFVRVAWIGLVLCFFGSFVPPGVLQAVLSPGDVGRLEAKHTTGAGQSVRWNRGAIHSPGCAG